MMSVPPCGFTSIEMQVQRTATVIDAIFCPAHAAEEGLSVVVIDAFGVRKLLRVTHRIVFMLARQLDIGSGFISHDDGIGCDVCLRHQADGVLAFAATRYRHCDRPRAFSTSAIGIGHDQHGAFVGHLFSSSAVSSP